MRAASSPSCAYTHYPLMILAVAFACGVLTGRAVRASPLAGYAIGGAATALCALVVVLCVARGKQRAASWLLVVAFFSSGALLVAVEQQRLMPGSVAQLYDSGAVSSSEPVEVTGVLAGAPEPAPDGFFLTLQVERLSARSTEQNVKGVVWLAAMARDAAARAEYDELELRYGARVRVMTMLRRAESFRNPGVPSLTTYLEGRGFDAEGTIKSPLLVERLDDERVFLPLAFVYEWRRVLLLKISRMFSAETAGVLEAALLGNRYYLARRAAERFREAGTFHLLVISGLHISFIGWLALVCARYVTRRRAWQFASAVVLLWTYALAVGAGASVVRAALMFTIVALAPVLGRPVKTFNALGAAALALLVWRPMDLFDPSFQLTFLSVLSIAALAWPLIEKLRMVGEWRPAIESPRPPVCPRWWRAVGEALFWSERAWQREVEREVFRCNLFKTMWAGRLERLYLQRPLRYAVCALLVSMSVQIGMLPLLVIYFHRLTFASLVLNIFTGALMVALSLVALAALLLSQAFGALAAPLVWLAEKIDWLLVHGVDPFVQAHIAFVRVPHYTNWAAIIYPLYYVPLAALVVALWRWQPLGDISYKSGQEDDGARWFLKWQYAAPLYVVALAVIIWHPLSAGLPDNRLRVDFLDVGQGDAALVTMPNGTTLLIDAGGRPNIGARANTDAAVNGEDDADVAFERDARSIGEAVVSEYLWWRGLDHVDYILATHADADHINGLSDIARNFRVRAALVARRPTTNAEYARFSASMYESGVPIQLVGRGDVLRFGGVLADVLWPQPTADANAPSRNNDSIVLRLRFGEKVFLLTGDMEKEAEAALLAAGDDIACDVIKVAHHGSHTSSTAPFITAAHPSLAVISVGLTSPFNHPHKEIVDRWKASGAQVLTTGQSGTITVSTDGHQLDLKTFVR